MSSNFATASLEITEAVEAVWPAVYGFQRPNGAAVKEVGKPHCRLDVLHDGGANGAIGGKRFTREGQVWVRTYWQLGNLAGVGDVLEAICGQFEGRSTTSGVWFRNVRIVTVGEENAMYRLDVRADFEYDRIRG